MQKPSSERRGFLGVALSQENFKNTKINYSFFTIKNKYS